MADIAPSQAVLIALRRRGVARAADLMRDTGINQPAFSRAVTALREQVLAIGQARARRYALARDVRGLGQALPLYRVDAAGKPGRIGTVHPLDPRGCWVEADVPLPSHLRGERGDGLYSGLPYFLADMQPQGFMGRGFSRRFPDLGLPANPATWSDDDALVALARTGDDCTGDLILGDPALERFYRTQLAEPRTIAMDERESAYAQRAEAAMASGDGGSSAGGEQPKFTATLEEAGELRQVLVKFSPAGGSPAAGRWADLLACEHIALETLRLAGLPAARSRLLRAVNRTFLEVGRFDRSGAAGRRPALSLLNLDAEFSGGADQWRLAGDRLAARGWLSGADARTLAALQAYGQFIANSDMHFGNVTLLPGAGETLTLAPTYDMLPMFYAPMNGEIVRREFVVPLPAAGREAEWQDSGRLGATFWEAIATDERVSVQFRKTAAQNAATVRRALNRLA